MCWNAGKGKGTKARKAEDDEKGRLIQWKQKKNVALRRASGNFPAQPVFFIFHIKK